MPWRFYLDPRGTKRLLIVLSAQMQGRHVVVTGGGGALGSGVVALLEARGATVHVAAHRPEVQLDDEAQAIAFYAALPPLWASIHLVGWLRDGDDRRDHRYADFETQWRLNTVTCFLACREAVKSIRKAAAVVGSSTSRRGRWSRRPPG